MQCAVEILTLILHTPYEDATFYTPWTVDLENLNSSRAKLLKKLSLAYTQPESKFTFTKTPKSSFLLIQVRKVHMTK